MDCIALINYMENLRYERMISQEEYLFGVVSQRQYYRYRYGESEVPFDVIINLASKLQIHFLKLLTQFIKESEQGKKLVQKYFNLVINKNNVQAEKCFNQINKRNIIDNDSRTLAKLGKIIFDHNRGGYSTVELCFLLKKHMRYTEMLKKDSLHDFEVYLLGLLMEFSLTDRNAILEKLIYLYINNKVLTGENRLYNSQVYFWIIKNLGRESRYEEVINFAKSAIDYCADEFSVYCLNYFHYYKALAHNRMGEISKFQDEIYNSIIVSLNQNTEKREKFFATILKDTGINAVDFLIDRFQIMLK